jgi:predicted transposase YbfD/YdcC
MFTLIEKLKKVKDFRKDQGKRYPMWLVLLVVIFATMSGYLNYREIEHFAQINHEKLIKYLRVNLPQMPSHSTIRRVMMGVDYSELISIFNEWALTNYSEKSELDWVAVDGKSLRSTMKNYGDKSQNFVAIISLFSLKTGLVVRMKKFENKKESEISATQELVRDCPMKGKVFTFDALHCNQKIIKGVIASKNDYLIAIKKNQLNLYRQIESLTINEEPLSINVKKEQSHGRKITRKTSVFINKSIRHKSCPKFQSFIKVERSGTRGIKDYQETVYYVSSLVADAQTFAEKIIGHWQIENQLHWVKDVIFREDNQRINHFQAATNFSTIKTIALNLFRILGFWSITEGQRWLGNQWYKFFILSKELA